MADHPGGLARPWVDEATAARVAREYWGVEGSASELGSQQDRNFLIESAEGRLVLKFANEATAIDELIAQNTALAALAAEGLRVPAAVTSATGSDIERVTVAGRELLTRALVYVEGSPLIDTPEFGAGEADRLGDVAGRIAASLSGFAHAGAHRSMQWDLRVAAEVVRTLVDRVPEQWRRDRLLEATVEASARLDAVADRLPVQTIHADITDDNVVIGPDGATGVIDFGDLQRGWRIAELAATGAAVFAQEVDDPVALLLRVARAFAAHVTLTGDELAALWPLIVLRTAVLVVSGEDQVRLDGDNDYADVRRAAEWRSFRCAAGMGFDELDTLVHACVRGARPSAPTEFTPLFPEGTRIAVVDLSVTSPELDAGVWLEPGIEERLLAHAAGEAGIAATRWGEHRLSRTRLHAPRGSAATLALGTDVRAPHGTELVAPFDGTVTGEPDGRLALRASGLALFLSGVHGAGARAVRRGDRLGLVDSPSVRVQLCTDPSVRPPFLVTPAAGRDWLDLCPDPSPLVGTDVRAPREDADALLARRDAAFARVQEHYYRRPPQIERGWREHLVDSTAQSFVDVVNNVATAGHSHPRLVAAAARQWALLNTNSRFHYAAVAELSERLARLAPTGLDTVFLVNSGSEAVDLALRLAMTATGRSRIMAAREAYHGWTIGSDAVSTSLGDNPRALQSRPAWVELIDAPNPIRGRHTGADAGARYLADLDARLEALGAEGRADLAGVILEPIFGNGGGVLLPDGYLSGVYERVRALGGVCIADEVQVGYGRLGEYFWGFEQQDAVPDVITIAKAMGNGHPIGAVLTSAAIADAFAAEGSFFSSAGGSPVSARIGLTVLDIMRDEGLQQNAAEVGARFKAGLEALATRHPAIGAVHGLGLYLGVELVTDPTTFAPAGELASQVCEAMLDEGVIVQPTGDHKNVLKVKPPLCITEHSASTAIDALDRVLTGLGR